MRKASLPYCSGSVTHRPQEHVSFTRSILHTRPTTPSPIPPIPAATRLQPRKQEKRRTGADRVPKSRGTHTPQRPAHPPSAQPIQRAQRAKPAVFEHLNLT